ncbi:hypothetical protein BH11CYA1_BH11CYA1_34810 [soil metagenome]
MSKFPIKSKSKTDIEKFCPQCRQPVNKRIDFCLDCGDFIEPLGKSGRQRAITALDSPPQARRVLRGSPLKTPVLLLAAGLATILLALFGLTVYECCNSFDASHKDLVRLAESYMAKGDEANAISVLERSLLEEKRPKQEQRQVLLDRALFAQASKMVTQGKYRDAVTYYSRISPGFEQHDEVLKLIAEYSDKALPVIFGASVSESSDKGQDVSPVGILMHQANSASNTNITSSAKSASMSRLEKAVMTVVPSSSNITKADKVSLERSQAPSLAKTVSSNSPTSVAAPAPASAVNGMARYNELLADYFAHHSGSASEPPSYEEWVKSGTKDF